MDLLALVDRLEELVASAQKMPIGSRAIVDRRRLLDIVDQMRVSIPEEVREAREMVAQREQRRLESEEEARLIVARAEDRAARLVEQHELTLAARSRAEEVAAQAEARLEERIRQANEDIERRITESRRLAEQQMDAADEYARELLERLDRQLQAFVRSVQSGISQLQDSNASRSSAGSAAPPESSSAGHRPGAEFEGETARPIPLRREERPADEGGLDNLLRRPAGTAPVHEPPAEEAPVVIDDFDMPDFDDGPSSPGAREP